MPRHHRHHHHDHDGPPIPPMPPEPPMPPMPPMACEGSRGFRFGDFAALVGMSPRHWRGSWGPFHFDFGEEGWSSGGGRGRRARRMFEGGELRLVLLKLISEQPRHGYDLIRAIEEMTGGQYAPSPGVVYPTLTLLEDMGLIEESPGEGSRKPFQITDAGRDHLDENADEAEELMRRLKSLSPSYSPSGGSPVWRAMRNLGVAIRNRLSHGDVTDETVHELAALIDEFAQRVERLK